MKNFGLSENLYKHRKFLKQIINILRKSNIQDPVTTFAFILNFVEKLKLNLLPKQRSFWRTSIQNQLSFVFCFNSSFWETIQNFVNLVQLQSPHWETTPWFDDIFDKLLKSIRFFKKSLVFIFKSMILLNIKNVFFWYGDNFLHFPPSSHHGSKFSTSAHHDN